MTYDPERDPGRSYETQPADQPEREDVSGVMGAVSTTLAWPILAFNGLVTPTSGGTLSLQDTIAQVAALQRSVQDQIRLINEFLRGNRETIDLVRNELKGSTKGYDQMMLTSLSQAETSLRASLSSLQQASTALDRVRQI
jgi:hypothetical protein